jgi:hypothetical protein
VNSKEIRLTRKMEEIAIEISSNTQNRDKLSTRELESLGLIINVLNNKIQLKNPTREAIIYYLEENKLQSLALIILDGIRKYFKKNNLYKENKNELLLFLERFLIEFLKTEEVRDYLKAVYKVK